MTERRNTESATITPYRDGPLIVRGPVRLQDMHGREIEQVVATKQPIKGEV